MSLISRMGALIFSEEAYMKTKSVIKDQMGYIPHPIKICKNCQYLKKIAWNNRCNKGNFAVRTMGTCNEYKEVL